MATNNGARSSWDNAVAVLDEYIKDSDGLPDLVARFLYSGVKKFAFPKLKDSTLIKENEMAKEINCKK